ncbi:MAG: phage integrase N-terminal SAM-like domain-containing protein, partial [Gammaproteobacteria bacterium]|nr:phage integrase N-terminal SAM-like domain-containing protein [Gammaproteobacteria bacterium]
QRIYTTAVRQLAAHYKRSPDQLTEQQVRSYLLELRERGAARGTFKTSQYGLRFFFRNTLRRNWGLFGEKKARDPTTEAPAHSSVARSSAPSAGPCPQPSPQSLPRTDVCLWPADQRGHHAGGHRRQPGPPGASGRWQRQQTTSRTTPSAAARRTEQTVAHAP